MSAALSREDRERLEALFDRAADLPRAEQAAFARRECGSNGVLRAELERLLEGLDGVDRLEGLELGACLPSGTRIGPYKLLEKIGEGGMGEVYAAEQQEPVVRRVALKIIKAGMDSAQVVARFEAERQALARMTHPFVAQVFDGGTTEAGRPYFVMEYVAGEPITEYCDRRKLVTSERVALFLGVCEGIQHAHQKGIVHRDLKPSNLMVTEQAGQSLPKIIDFGVARATTGRLSERTLHTTLGQIVGTLDYMSPEQADPTGVDIDTRSDIYSLGVVLYQLVSGLLPFEHSSALDVPLSEVQRAIRESDAPRPSTRLRRQTDTTAVIAPLHGTDGRSLVRQLSDDLDWICLKALEKDPARRYASASELAEDLRRHLAHEPVLASRPGALYRTRKFVRRHRLGVTAGVLVAGAVLAGVVGIVTGQLEARASERFARAAIDAERVLAFEVMADELWPPYPEQIPQLADWLERAREVASRLPDYRALEQELRERAGGAETGGPAEPPELAEPTGIGTADFEDPGDARKYAAVVRAIAAGERLQSGLLADDLVTEEHAWSVPKRLAFAEQLERGFAAGGEYAVAWEDALSRLPDARADLDGDGVLEPAYTGLALRPVMGLVPLGPDAESGLWLFAHLMTGEPAELELDAAGKGTVFLGEETGLVMVLIPGEAPPDDGTAFTPDQEQRLPAFFLSKYEMTQGQWVRLTGRNPSAYAPDDESWGAGLAADFASRSLLHPVEQVSWFDCDTWLRRAGLAIPSTAQWAFGARAGTRTRFWAGSANSDLEGVANLRDAAFRESKLEGWAGVWDHDDGSAVHWEVGHSQRANAFGLHDIHGNVWEWCFDFSYDPGVTPRSDPAGAPVGNGSRDERRNYRGGSWRGMPGQASVERFDFDPPTFWGSARGVRPGKDITD